MALPKPGFHFYILLGGSLVQEFELKALIAEIKRRIDVPLILFPGAVHHILACEEADALLFLSLISGRNPEFLIGQQVQAAPIIQKMGIEPISTGYMLIDSGKATSALYMSNTYPIPHDKPDIACATALAGQYLGLKMIYLEAGSGAGHTVPLKMIQQVKSILNIPLWVGGGIRDEITIQKLWTAGADIVVIGTLAEEYPELFLNLWQGMS